MHFMLVLSLLLSELNNCKTNERQLYPVEEQLSGGGRGGEIGSLPQFFPIMIRQQRRKVVFTSHALCMVATDH